MKRHLLLALCLGLLAGAPQARAQDAAQAAARNAEADEVVLDRFATCVVRGWRRGIVNVLEQAPGTPEERTRLSSAAGDWGECLAPLTREQGALVFQADVLRGPLAEALYERDFAAGEERSRSLATLPDPLRLVRQPNRGELAYRAAVMGVFATCVVAQRPAEVGALLATRPASRQEQAAIGVLSPLFGDCFPAGSEFEITIPLLRGFLAEALYRHAATGTETAQ